VYTSWRNQNLNDYSGNNGAYVNGDGWVQVTIPAGDYVALAP
jgi:pSer/pThr/pTyr-binding forkhead associated (FHA) protein